MKQITKLTSKKIQLKRIAFMSCLAMGLSACAEKTSQTVINSNVTDSTIDSDFEWNIPAKLPLPVVPDDNPITEAKFQLGKHLFYDKRLSGNGSQACESCHHQDKAFSDGEVRPSGSTGIVHPRNSQALVNTAYNASVNWANPSTVTLEQQTPIPLFGEFPVELGINDENKMQVLQRLEQEPKYSALFSQAFPDENIPIQFDNITKSLASFVRGLNSFNSPYDDYINGDESAISDSAKRGLTLFSSETLECFHCHAGNNFSQSYVDRTQFFADMVFFNNGLYNIDDKGGYPIGGEGVYEITAKQEDMGLFRPPTLRNIALTAPYMHDGSIDTLEDVVKHYAAGGRNITFGPNAGDGRKNPNKSSFVQGFSLSEQDQTDLVNFLKSLTDQDFITNPRFSNPWE